MAKVLLLGLFIALGQFACSYQSESQSLSAQQTVLELRVVKGQPRVAAVNEPPRLPYPRERLAVGANLTQDGNSLSYLRADSGSTLLLSGNANVTVESAGLKLNVGRLFVDTQGGAAVELRTDRGIVEIAEGRSSITVDAGGSVEVYVLRGTSRYGDVRARAGETMRVSAEKKATLERTATWDDWTLGLATADPEAQPAPFGVGTVGARAPADQGKPRFPLVIQRLEVRVDINQDFVTTEVDETFVNPSENVVEGLYGFRVPPNAVLSRFGVDRDGLMVWGQIKEKNQAKAQYESNVYAGSTEDPALLEWVQRGVYQARLYPIAAGASRRLVTRYSEWLGRQGEQGERRLYVYPMAATGAEGTLPRIEEMTFRVDYSKAKATRIRAPRGAVQRGHEIVIKAHDFTPKADVFLELYDSGSRELVAYRAPHVLEPNDIPKEAEVGFAERVSGEEQDYLLLPLPTAKAPVVEPGLDLVLVVDSSAATDPRALGIARHLVAALLNALGPQDRAALFAGDTGLRPVLPESDQLKTIDEARRKTYLAALANVPLGGATDLGILLASAAERLDAKRHGAVIYIGDGRPSVGEMLSKTLRERLERLPPTTRILAAGTGPEVNAPLLESLVRGGPLELIGNGYEAALASLRLLEAANSNTWQGSQVEVSGLERLLPKQVPAVAAGEPALVVGRVSGKLGTNVSLHLGGKTQTLPLRVLPLTDEGDLRRRWGEGRLTELTEQQSGRLALVDIARRYGLVTPLTSLYVATRAEAEQQGQKQSLFSETVEESKIARRSRWRPWTLFSKASQGLREEASAPLASADEAADNKEGGTGTRAKGEEGSMGNPTSKATNKRYSVQGPKDSPDPHIARAAALEEAQEFGMIGLVATGAGAPAVPLSAETNAVTKPTASALRGSGGGRLGGSHKTVEPKIRIAPLRILGTFDEAMASRIVRQNYGRFRQCYEAGLARDPNLKGAVTLKLGVSETGAVTNVTLSEKGIADTDVAQCALQSAYGITFPPPEQGRVTLFVPLRFGEVGEGDFVAELPLKPIPKQLVVDTHQPVPCSQASNLPLPERRRLWAERLVSANGTESVLQVYRLAITQCEASSFFERQWLLYAMVDRLPSIAERVELYRKLLDRPTAAMVVYRAVLARIQDAEGLKQLHVALGLKQPDEDLLKRLLDGKKPKQEQLATLRGLLQKWPEDLELGLRLLYALEDTDEHAAARAQAQKLRKRSDATTHVRTAVGEFYLRQAALGIAGKVRDEVDARRCFGEIVEFAAEDPVARRILGDLMLTHGWYEEASRQYETLKLLLPEDPTVELRLAEAAYGMGKTEEALRWTEKARATASPDGQTELDRASQAWASVFVAWAHQDAIKAGKADVASRLLVRGQRLRSGELELGTKFILTWAHPELRPTLWLITSLGETLARNMTLLGVAEGSLSGVTGIEIRIDPEDSAKVGRLAAPMTLTAISNEGTEQQQIVTKQVQFGRIGALKSALRMKYRTGEFVEEVL